MTLPFNQWIAALLLAIAIGGIAFRLRALAPSGAIAATLLGAIVVGTGGWWMGTILVAFFATSSLLSKLSLATSLRQARGDRRDWIQVAANGWGILSGCLAYALTGWTPWLLFGVGAIAAATADTWSSEIGRTSPTPPRLVTNWHTVPRGTSGAVSGRGLLASLLGALFIAILAGLGGIGSSSAPVAIIGVSLAGFAGGLLDSLLGATIQEQRWCDSCRVRTEQNPHGCGTTTRHIAGIRGFNNDVVNMLCVLGGALIGLVSGIL